MDIPSTLRAAGLRATKQRQLAYKLLQDAQYPMDGSELLKRLPKGSADLATVYRILDQFERSGFVQRSETRDGRRTYEFADRPHHHHIVCNTCGTMEDIDGDVEAGLEKRVVRRARRFARIESHTLEFFGTCNACLK